MSKLVAISLLSLFTVTSINAVYYYTPDIDEKKMDIFLNQVEDLSKNGSGWLSEDLPHIKYEKHLFGFSRILAKGETEFQDYVFIENAEHGKMLFIDGVVQSAQKDEQIYHESLVQPAMVLHPSPRSILVIGAGEGATAREILRHPMVERLVLIDIDEEIVQKTKELLPEWHEGAFDHPKVELIIMDGKEFVEETKEKFDVVVIDICDKLSGGPAEELYSEKFYRSIKQNLNPLGILVVQSMEFSEGPEGEDHRTVHRNIKKVFSKTASYGVFVPSFWSNWGFVIASDSAAYHMPVETIDQTMQERGISNQLKHYDGQFHQHLFYLNKAMRKMIEGSVN